MGSLEERYSPVDEAERIFHSLCASSAELGLPSTLQDIESSVNIHSDFNRIYFPIPFKETETAAALKALEGSVACALADLKWGSKKREVDVDLERATCFLFQAYLATVDSLRKYDTGVKSKLKDTDYLHAQSNPYRRMSVNLYATKEKGQFFHIHGSLEATTTLNMIGLDGFRPDLVTHKDIIDVIEPAVQRFTLAELEVMNAEKKQAGVTAFRFEDFLKTPHGAANWKQPPWTVAALENTTPPVPLPNPRSNNLRILEGIKVLELCRIIAGPTITRILGEYGADLIKVTGPGLSDVPFFQVDGNMGKHTTELNLKDAEDRKIFEQLLADVDIIVDGYRPGALARLGYGAYDLSQMAKKRGKGIVYVNENCFGYQGEWVDRPGWQQIADCVSGVARAQGKFMGLNEPVVPPFPISDYGTGCMGAIAALSGLYHRTSKGGSWHGKVSLLQYDLLLHSNGQYPEEIQAKMRANVTKEFLALTHSHSVDDISGTTLAMFRSHYPELLDKGKYCETWFSQAYNADICVVKPVIKIEDINIGFQRGSRPNASDGPTWEFMDEQDFPRRCK